MADNLKELTAGIVASYVEGNAIAAGDLPALIKSTFAALNSVGQPPIEEPKTEAKPTAAQIRKSITPDALISFIDGRPYAMLKRHLTRAGLTPADYRARFGLPNDYPVTAASYSAKRSALALSAGLGRKPASEPVAPPSPAPEPASIAAKSAVNAAPKTPKGEKAGPGARVPKAVRSPNAIAPADDEFT